MRIAQEFQSKRFPLSRSLSFIIMLPPVSYGRRACDTVDYIGKNEFTVIFGQSNQNFVVHKIWPKTVHIFYSPRKYVKNMRFFFSLPALISFHTPPINFYCLRCVDNNACNGTCFTIIIIIINSHRCSHPCVSTIYATIVDHFDLLILILGLISFAFVSSFDSFRS